MAVPAMLEMPIRDFVTWRRQPYFQPFAWRRLGRFTLAAGKFLHNDALDQPTYETLLGAEVTRRTGLKLDDRSGSWEEMASIP